MKTIIDLVLGTFVLLIFNLSPCNAQSQTTDFSAVDAKALKIKYAGDIKKLSKALTSTYSNDLEKVRSIFRWITENIAYDTKEFHNKNGIYSATRIKLAKEPAATYDQKFNTEIVKHVLNTKAAICDGYARLFKTLCDQSGLIAEVVSGDAKNSLDDIGKGLDTNHAWNAVLINNKWQLLDVTWASGYCDEKVTKFTKKFKPGYFLVEPEKLIINHYPENPHWTLLKNNPPFELFSKYPLAHGDLMNSEIVSFSPTDGIVKAKMGDTVHFTIVCKHQPIQLTSAGNDEVSQSNVTSAQAVYNFTYKIISEKTKEINIYLDSKCILSYKLELQKTN